MIKSSKKKAKTPVKISLREKKKYAKQILESLVIRNQDGTILAPTTCGYCEHPLRYRQNGRVFCDCPKWERNVDDPVHPPKEALSGWKPVTQTTRKEKINPKFIITGEDGNLWTPTKCGYCGNLLRYNNGIPFCYCSAWNQNVYDTNPSMEALSGWKIVKQKTV